MKLTKILQKVLLGLFCVGGVSVTSLTLSACNNTTTETQEQKYTVTFDSKGGSAVASSEVVSGQTVSKPENPTRSDYTFKHWSTTENGEAYDFATPVEGNLTLYAVWEAEVAQTYTVTFNTGEGSAVNSQTVESGKVATEPEAPTAPEGHKFKHWSTIPDGDKYDFSTPVTANLTLYAVWEEIEYETLTRSISLTTCPGCFSVPGSSGPILQDGVGVDGFFTFYGSKIRYESSRQCVNTAGTVSIKETYTDNSVSFTIEGCSAENPATVSYTVANASSSATAPGFALYDADGKVAKDKDGNECSGSLTSGDTSTQVSGTFTITTPGTYYLGGTAGSLRVYALSYSERIEKSEPTAIEVTTVPQVDFLEGREFTYNGLVVKLVYGNGRTETLSPYSETNPAGYIITAPTADNMKTPGSYTVKVSADIVTDENEYSFEDEYTINVYDLVSVDYSLYDYQNRVTVYTPQLFAVGSTFSHENLVVYGNGEVTVNGEKLEKQFILTSGEYTVSKPDLSAAKNDVSVVVSSNVNGDTAKTKEYLIDVVDTTVVTDKTANITISVDGEKETSVAANAYTFPTVNKALAFLELVEIADEAVKTINVAKGEYHEKVEVTLPNVHLVGSNTSVKSTETVITFGAYNGQTVPGGNGTFSTDGSSTVSVRATATGFEASNITIANDINTLDEYTALRAITSDTQAVALMVQADQVYVNKVYLTGYQDTLYARDNRQIYEECYIEGRTDYIFGDGADTTLFLNCTIHHLASPSGDANKNGGYIVATKGTKDLVYGYIFDSCTFDAEEGVVAGTVSLARGWDEYMTMMVMDSTLGGHISTEAYGEATLEADGTTPAKDNKNDRYGKMNADPDATRLLEYNNTGAGAISASLANTCTVVDEATAKPYGELLTIFGKDTNTAKDYAEDWTHGKVAYDAVITYYNGTQVVGTQNDYVGTTIDKLLSGNVVEGTFGGWYTDAALTTKYDASTLLTGNLSLYGQWSTDTVTVSDTYKLDDLVGSVSQGSTVIDNDNITFATGSTSGGNNVVVTSATANDDSGLAFTSAMMGTGGSRVYNLTAKTDCKVTIYFNTANGDFTGAAHVEKSGELTVDGTAVSSKGTIKTDKACAYTIELTAGQSVVLSASSNRLVVYGLTVSYEKAVEAKGVLVTLDDLVGSVSQGSTVVDNDNITFATGSTSGGNNVVVTSATANDDSGLTFTSAMMGTGGSRVYNLTAKTDCKVTIYFNTANGDFTGAAHVEKSGELTVDGTAVSSKGTIKTDKACAYTIELTAGQSVVLSASSNRLVVYGLYIEA